MAQKLYPGCDVWLNNPLRPLEACGTSRDEGRAQRVPQPLRPGRLVGRVVPARLRLGDPHRGRRPRPTTTGATNWRPPPSTTCSNSGSHPALLRARPAGPARPLDRDGPPDADPPRPEGAGGPDGPRVRGAALRPGRARPPRAGTAEAARELAELEGPGPRGLAPGDGRPRGGVRRARRPPNWAPRWRCACASLSATSPPTTWRCRPSPAGSTRTTGSPTPRCVPLKPAGGPDLDGPLAVRGPAVPGPHRPLRLHGPRPAGPPPAGLRRGAGPGGRAVGGGGEGAGRADAVTRGARRRERGERVRAARWQGSGAVRAAVRAAARGPVRHGPERRAGVRPPPLSRQPAQLAQQAQPAARCSPGPPRPRGRTTWRRG